MRFAKKSAFLSLAAVAALAACGAEPQVQPADPTTKETTPPVAETKPAAPAVDLLGPKPELPPSRPFTPPTVETFTTKNGLSVWLVEKHGLPLVSAVLVVRGGSSADPAKLPGLMHITTDMLDEGAGKRSAVEVSSGINDLGATLALGTSADASILSLTVLKNNFNAAFGIFSDVVARPHFDAKEWKRVSELWQNNLKKRSDEPMSVSRVLNAAVLFGPDTPYGHPADGSLEAATKLDLPTVKRFYTESFRPDRAVLVVAGDISRKEVTDIVDAQLGAWKAPPAKAAPKQADLPGPRPASARPKLVLVDRPGAPQSVIAVVRDGVAANDPALPRLELINTALGGSFTSRLNMNLREEHHWAYGAGSTFQESRNKGGFWAIASVETPATGVALKEMLSELSKMAASGPTAEELEKAKAQDRADLMQTYETVSGTARRLATLARLGLSPAHDSEATRARQSATLTDVTALAKTHVDPGAATVIVVGPREAVGPQLATLGLGEPELWDPEGKPANAAAKPADQPAAKATDKPAPKKGK
ncbi:pitrilysin family protein [Polyangium sp. 15x6]|uniref:M16 family metallopeptidase n=1 Tax=Polyangium sp. 15x6 TaxID=3042687 RepID=UPI00249C37C3|nr:pitrilysin family protein [Polyangium sp. 15x6]MDI3287691.1 pitrilysin family protein [Polyangium sp. 15x6]